MTKINLILNNIKPFSINSYYYGTRRVRTREARLWGEDIHRQLQVYRYLMVDFQKQFNPTIHTLHCSLRFSIPNLFTKAGEINHQSKDLSNIEKPLLDIVTGRKYFDRGEPTLNIDDKYITRLLSEKVYGSSYTIEIEFEIK